MCYFAFDSLHIHIINKNDESFYKLIYFFHYLAIHYISFSNVKVMYAIKHHL